MCIIELYTAVYYDELFIYRQTIRDRAFENVNETDLCFI